MANGKPGDHPLTDIFVHNLGGISPEIDQLFRDIYAIGGWDALNRVWDELESDPDAHVWRAASYKEGLDDLEIKVRKLRDQLRQDAQGAGS